MTPPADARRAVRRCSSSTFARRSRPSRPAARIFPASRTIVSTRSHASKTAARVIACASASSRANRMPNVVLTVVRQQYPTAFTTCLCDEDRRFTRGYLPDTTSTAPSASPKPAVAVVAPTPAVAKTPATAKAEAPKAPPPRQSATVDEMSPAAAARRMPAAAAPAKSATPAPAKGQRRRTPQIVEVSWEPPAPAQKAARRRRRKRPVVDAEVAIDDFSWEPPALKPLRPQPTSRRPPRPGIRSLSPVYKTQPS